MEFIDIDDCVMVGGLPLLNSIFGVGENKLNAAGDEILRLIMNLIPSTFMAGLLGGLRRKLSRSS